MTVFEIKKALNAKLVIGETMLGNEVKTACGTDMLSDVLAYVKNQAVLLTGLCNFQVMRTAEMMDMACVIFVSGKKSSNEMVEHGRQKGIAILETHLSLFTACGILYEKGIRGGDSNK